MLGFRLTRIGIAVSTSAPSGRLLPPAALVSMLPASSTTLLFRNFALAEVPPHTRQVDSEKSQVNDGLTFCSLHLGMRNLKFILFFICFSSYPTLLNADSFESKALPVQKASDGRERKQQITTGP
jgi:hypothetical protein